MGIISEFKEFALKGSMFDTAVGIIIGGAMGTVIGSLVKDVIMPIVGAVGGQPDFSAIKLGPILFGNFLNALIAFLVLAWVVFMLVKAVNTAKAMASKPAPGRRAGAAAALRGVARGNPQRARQEVGSSASTLELERRPAKAAFFVFVGERGVRGRYEMKYQSCRSTPFSPMK